MVEEVKTCANCRYYSAMLPEEHYCFFWYARIPKQEDVINGKAGCWWYSPAQHRKLIHFFRNTEDDMR